MFFKKPIFWISAAVVSLCVAVAVCFWVNPSQNLGETNPEKLTQEQNALMESFPDYFGLNAAKGLDVYVWQMSGGRYSLGLQPHSAEKMDMWSRELMDMKEATPEQMRQILATYAIEPEDVTVVLWQHPFSSYLPDYCIVEEGEDPESKAEDYAKTIRQTLFETE